MKTVLIPLWLAVFGLFAWSGSSVTFAMGVVVLLVGGTALTITPLLWNPPLALEPSAGMVPNSWPDSGFRNFSRRSAGGV